MMCKVTVVDFDGSSVTGMITGGDPYGVFVQEPNGHPKFYNFTNIRALIVIG